MTGESHPDRLPEDKPALEGLTPKQQQSAWDEAKQLATSLPRYVKLAWRLGSDERIPPSLRWLLMGGSIYAVSPVDLIPGVIPVLGQLDNIIVLLAAILRVVDEGPFDVVREHLQETEISRADLAADLNRAKELAVLTAKGYGRVIWGAARVAGRVSMGAANLTVRTARAAGRGVSSGVEWLRNRRGKPAGE